MKVQKPSRCTCNTTSRRIFDLTAWLNTSNIAAENGEEARAKMAWKLRILEPKNNSNIKLENRNVLDVFPDHIFYMNSDSLFELKRFSLEGSLITSFLIFVTNLPNLCRSTLLTYKLFLDY